MTDDQHGEGTPRGGSRWDPLPQGEYDDGATAFVELPEGGVDALLAADSPLAAPGHGYVPPQITVSPAPTAGTDPAATGAWPVPGAPVDGTQWHDPNAGHPQHGPEHGGHQQQGHDVPEQPYGGSDAPYDPGTPYGSDATAPQHGGDDRFTYNPGATGQWNFEETAAAGAAPGHDVTGQWSIPVAGGDLPDESGEFTTSSLVEQWGGTPPATLPGGAPAPWATQAAGRPWGQDPQDAAGQEETHPGYPHEPGHEHEHEHDHAHGPDHAHEQDHDHGPHHGHGRGPDRAYEQDHAHGQQGDAGPASGFAPEQQAAEPLPQEAGPGEAGPGHPRDAYAPGAHEDTGASHRPGEFGHAPEASGTDHAPQPSEYAPEEPGSAGRTAEPSRFADQRADHGADHAFEPSDFPGQGPEASAPDDFAQRYPEAPGAFHGEPGPEVHPEAAALPRDAQEASQSAPGPGEASDPGEPSEDASGAPEAAEGPSEHAARPLPAFADADTGTGTDTGPETADGENPDDPAPDEAPAAETTDAAPDALAAAPHDTPPAAPHEEHPLASYVLRVNGAERPVGDAWIGESLLYVLRERLGLAGAKDGCSQGECGACNVQVDGRLVASCLVPAVTAAGSEVRTVEGLAEDGQPSDVQRALARCGAVQCGFCVPGMAMTVHDLLEGNPAPTELETRQALCGNLCRCSGYRGVVDAVKEVVAEREAHSAPADGDTDGARIPHQAGPGAGGVNASAFGAPPEPHTPGPHSPEPHEQPYGQDGGPA
ncbi:2Fe-2S iron-sulfur cluster-binding protein [Streptomyces sp. NPDC088801]|uniref:2Fe-2S iron-sulfur cluster-binding protein n=1 Tax=Streptomyces sp. NPDC088801 TaxID=3365903 RepID=UPI00381370EB